MFGIKILQRDESLLGVAIVGLLIAAVAALVVLPGTVPHRTGSPEAGALLAPSSNQSLTEALGAPGAPTDGFESSLTGGSAGTTNGGGSNEPAPNNPGDKPGGPTTNPPPPPNNGLLPDLPFIPPLPPPLGGGHGRGSIVVAFVRGIQ